MHTSLRIDLDYGVFFVTVIVVFCSIVATASLDYSLFATKSDVCHEKDLTTDWSFSCRAMDPG